MPSDDEALPSFAPQWLRSSPSPKASLGAGAGGSGQSKADARSHASLRPGLIAATDRDSRRVGVKSAANGSGPSGSPGTPAAAKARSAVGTPGGSRSGVGGSRPFRSGSLEGAPAGHDSSFGPYREDDEGRFNFGGGLGRAKANAGRAASLDAPATTPRRPWDEPKGGGRAPERSPTVPLSRHDNGGGMRRAPEATRGAALRGGGGFDRDYPSLGGPRAAPGRPSDGWQPLSPARSSALTSPGRSDTDAHWTSRLADVSPGRAASISALLSSPGGSHGSLGAATSAPATPRPADPLQQGARVNSAEAEAARRQPAAAHQSRQPLPVAAASPVSGKAAAAFKPRDYSAAAAAAPTPAPVAAPPTSGAVLLGHVASNGGAPRRAPSVDTPGRAGSGGTLTELGGTPQQASTPQKAQAGGSAAGTPVKAAGVAPGAAREKDRNSFFKSLRSKGSPAASLPDSSADAVDPQPARSALSAPQSPAATQQHNPERIEDPAAGANAAQSNRAANGSLADTGAKHAPHTSEAPSTAAAAAGGDEAHGTGENGGSQQGAAAMGNGNGCSSAGKAGGGGSRKAQLVIPAEEEAFLRSLGWEACSDDEDEGGLTEEEIAAFHAKAQAVHFQQRLGAPTPLMNGIH